VQSILAGLERILGEFERGEFAFHENDEDIHTAVERRLTELTGPVGGKLHTGRSRNDQVATDFRLWCAEKIVDLQNSLAGLQSVLVDRAERDWGIPIPGYTHTQPAQPVLLSHWWLSHFWALQRDWERMDETRRRTLVMPLGCGALAGTGFAIDRFALAEDLGFAGPANNSLDAIGDRDFAAEILFEVALAGAHLSRLAEALILFSTREFGYIGLADAFSTGSSLMPQKKNPDPLELIRAKSGVLTGRLTGWLTTLKGLPSAYDKDLQEDKPAVFDAVDTLELLLPVMGGVIATLTVRSERMQASIVPQMMATDLADLLVRRGVPFRQAHAYVGKVVRRAEDLGVELPAMPIEEWQAIYPGFDSDVFQVFNVQSSLELHNAHGGTAPDAVRIQLDLAKNTLGKPSIR
jgi:argininosuccinate lyase